VIKYFSTITTEPGPSPPKNELLGSILAEKKYYYILPALPPLFSKLHIRLMNPIVQIGKIKIAPQKNPILPPNVLQLLYCQRYYYYPLSAHKIFCT